MSVDEKSENYKKFITGENRLLITTDMMARGISMITIGMVINFDVPTNPNGKSEIPVPFPMNYIYRTCRKGIFGEKCFALTLIAGETE